MTWSLILEGKKGNDIIFEVCYFCMLVCTHFNINNESYFRNCVGQASSDAMVFLIAFVQLTKKKNQLSCNFQKRIYKSDFKKEYD